MKMQNSVKVFVAAACLAVAGVASSSLAQPAPDPNAPPKPPAPPTLGKPDEPPTVMSFLVMVLIIGAVMGANLIPSKRGHQD
jgi:hypothetical protein